MRKSQATYEMESTLPRLNIHKAMKKAKIESLYVLAQKLEITYSNVFKMTKKGWNPKFSTLKDICLKLDIKMKDLIDD